MPMDNNDNHYPGLSEENSKITSVLHPYGLPKFDFDHTHVRFDSLAENEVFLGISSRGDNNWIEDFSRRNSGVEFASSSAECCSIPRHVDVWSEATSSESVEMLLQSVGQDEMLPGESLVEESDACDELSKLTKQMKSMPEEDGNRNDQDSNLGVPKVQPLDNMSRPKDGSEVADIDPKCSSPTQVEHSASGCLVNLKSDLIVHEWNSQDEESCDNENQQKHGTSLNYNREGTFGLGTQRCSDLSSHSVREDMEFSNGQDRPSAKPLEKARNEPTQKNACHVNDASVYRLPDTTHSSMSEFPVFVSTNEDATRNFEEPSTILTKEETPLLPTKGNSQDFHSIESCQNSNDLTLLESLEIKHSTDVCDKSFGGSEGDLRINKQDASSLGVEAHGVDIKCEQLKSLQSPTSHTESSVECKESSHGSHSQVEKRVSANISEGQISGREAELEILIIEDPVNQVDNLPILADVSLSAQSVAEHIAENQNGRNGATHKHEDTVLCSVSSGTVMSVEAANSSTQDPESNVGSNDAFSNDSNVALHERSNASTDETAKQNELNSASDVEPMHLDKTVDTDADVILKQKTSSLKDLSQVESETGTFSLATINLAGNVSAEVMWDESSLALMQTHDVAPLNESATINRKETLGCTDTMDVDSVAGDSNVVVAETTGTVAIVKHMETEIENRCQKELSEASGGGCFEEADKPSHGIASVTRYSKLPAPDETMKEDHLESAAEHASDSTSKAGEVPSLPKNDRASEGSREEISFSFDVPPLPERESGSTPSGSQKRHGVRQVPQVVSIITEGGSASIGAKTTSEHKTRRGSAKSTKKNAKKGNNVRQVEDNTSCTLVSQSGSAQLLQFSVGISDADGGRSSWELKWRACVEKLHSTPIQSRSGSKGQAKLGKRSASQSKVVPSATNLFYKETPSVAVKPMIPRSSPVWNLSTPSSDGLPPSNMVRGGAPQVLPPIHPCQTLPAQSIGGQTSLLLPASISAPWVSSSRSSDFDISAGISSSPSAEMVKSTTLGDSSLATSSFMEHDFRSPVSHGCVSSSLVQDSSVQKLTSYPVDSKSRKRGKSRTTEESPQNSLLTTMSLPYSDVVTSNSSKKSPAVARLCSISSHFTAPLLGGHFSTIVAVTASPVAAVDPIQRRELHIEKSFTHREELKQVVKAKMAGKEAVAHAADLVSRCQSVCSDLEEQRNSSLAPNHELQLSSSAAAMAAAASVAKAAAAAANLASAAAVHFHQVAIQVLHGNAITAQESETSMFDVANNLSDATPASILVGNNGNDAPYSIISAAREASRRKVVASQHAENLDAIMIAAELAAEAVSQAGRVVAMVKPLPSSVLVEAGPENYIRGDLQLVKSITEKGDGNHIGSSKQISNQSEGPDSMTCTIVEGITLPKDIVSDISGKKIRVYEAIPASHISAEEVISEMENSPAPDHAETDSLASDHVRSSQKALGDDCIKENCTIEVFKDGGSFKGAWYSAKVLSLDEEKALVCFTDLQSEKESGSLREWIPLGGKGNNVPNIRVAHPMPVVHFDRTRKRRRSASTGHQWSMGDRVDAWSKDCWREGLITEQKSNDPTTFTVHFPAHGETSVVKAWHLRPALTWKNGKWIELLTLRQSAPSQGDTPHGNRLKSASRVEVKGKGEIPKTANNLELENVDEPKLLPLSSTETVFNIGSNRDDNKVGAPKMTRSGLQKEGLKFFGVPRPGKKRKFMEVSKHIVSEQSNKNDAPSDTSKLSKYLMPRGTGSCGFKDSSNVSVKKYFTESMLRAPYTGKLPGISSRTLSLKENSISTVSRQRENTIRSRIVKGSISNNERGSSNLISSGSGSNNKEATHVPLSTQSLHPDSNKKASQNINSERTMKGKLAVAGGGTEAAAEDKLLSDSNVTRRSNRKIQPTSRLLESLQSSLITSKIPSASHPRSHRLQRKFVSRGTSSHH